MDGQKQLELSDHESKAVQPQAMQTIQANNPRWALAVVSTRRSHPVSQASAEVSQPHGTQIQTWPCRTVETDASQPHWAVYHPGSPCAFHPLPWTRAAAPPAPRHPGDQTTDVSTGQIRAEQVQYPTCRTGEQ
ncbi:hypothetical protein MTO96_006869 [Rhipicephalus appendiculatus]